MDRKVVLTAAIVVAFLLSSSILVTFYNPVEEDKEIRLIGRVNTEGSGIYLAPGESRDTYVTITGDGIDYYPDNWGGKIFGTPGVTSIQHMQLQSIVKNDLGLNFAAYEAGKTLRDDTVYFLPSVTNANIFIQTLPNEPNLVGGILWEPQFSKLIEEYHCTTMLLTSDFQPGHTCCVIGASHEYITSNPDVTVRFLAAYVKSVDAINQALSDRGSVEYSNLVSIAKARTGISDDAVIQSALETVSFVYGNSSPMDTDSAPLTSLKEDITNLVDSFYALGGTLMVTLKSLGFSSSHEFAENLVDDGYLSQALDFTPAVTGYAKKTISISYITGDIHTCLALFYGESLGYFAEYGIELDANGAANGAGVATSLQNGEADFGFMGAPPITMTVINGSINHG